MTLLLCGHLLHHFFYTRESCLCALYTHMSICVTILILMYPYTEFELPLFLYIVLNSPDVPDLIAGSLNLVRTIPKKLYVIAFCGFSCPTHFETNFFCTLLVTDLHFSYTHSSVGYTFYVPTHIMNNLFVYLPFTCVSTEVNFTLDLPSCIINHFLSTCSLVNPLLSI